VIQGNADHVCPLALTGELLAAGIATARLHVIDQAPHGLLWTHANQVNEALLGFLHSPAG
jgi:non-heme chloroperoxidase